MEKKKINLLLADDDEQFLETTAKTLGAMDFNVIAVNQGEKAVETARKNPIDIALVDLKMPGMGGIQTLEALKSEHELMEVVIILTGYATLDSIVQCFRSGAYSFLHKPCELDHLLDLLNQAYEKCVMNKIKEEKMREILKTAKVDSPMHIMERVKKLDELGHSPNRWY